jgi:hypothetical protein
LRSYGVEYVSFTEAHFRTTGPAGELMIAVAAWIAEQERKRISERTKAGLAKARRQGRIGGRRSLVVDREQIARLDEEGLTTREIALAAQHTAVTLSSLDSAYGSRGELMFDIQLRGCGRRFRRPSSILDAVLPEWNLVRVLRGDCSDRQYSESAISLRSHTLDAAVFSCEPPRGSVCSMS